MDSEDFNIVIGGASYHRLEDVPERYRETIRTQIEAARASAQSASQSTAREFPDVRINRHFNIKLNVRPLGGAGAQAATPGAIRAEGISGAKLVAILIAICGLVAWTLLRR